MALAKGHLPRRERQRVGNVIGVAGSVACPDWDTARATEWKPAIDRTVSS